MKDGQAIGVGAGQQSRIHCTRLAGGKADNWHLRQHEKVLNLPFREDIGRPDRDNAIDVYISEDWQDVLDDGQWQRLFTVRPEPLTREEKRAYLDTVTDVAPGWEFSSNFHLDSRGRNLVMWDGGDSDISERCYGVECKARMR